MNKSRTPCSMKSLPRSIPTSKKQDLRHFYTRLGTNFYAIYTLLHRLYGRREDFEAVALRLLETLARQYIARSTKLKKMDVARGKDYTWFLSQEWVGMALYSDGFAGNLKGLQSKIAYLQELGINLLHILPLLRCPEGANELYFKRIQMNTRFLRERGVFC